jgi:peroxiredoxin
MAEKRQIKEAPDFDLKDTLDKEIRLSDYREKKFVLLVLMRGFA